MCSTRCTCHLPFNIFWLEQAILFNSALAELTLGPSRASWTLHSMASSTIGLAAIDLVTLQGLEVFRTAAVDSTKAGG
eukprot:6479886-Amphidinium_carterae.2